MELDGSNIINYSKQEEDLEEKYDFEKLRTNLLAEYIE
jgi:predicted RNA-binding protein with PIN domain